MKLGYNYTSLLFTSAEKLQWGIATDFGSNSLFLITSIPCAQSISKEAYRQLNI